MERDDEGHRTYSLTTLVKCTSPLDGPQTVMNASGLPATGSVWNQGNDFDFFAFCYPTIRVAPVRDYKHEPGIYWHADQTFSTRPLSECQDETIDDPLLIPPKVSGSFVKYTKEAIEDKDGELLKSSTHEVFRGPAVERDYNRPTVRIEINRALLGLDTFSSMVDTVNNDTLWDLTARKIKLSNVLWERKIYGTCDFYYTVVYEFDIDFATFDRRIVDEGHLVLKDGGTASNPDHMEAHQDNKGNLTRVLLDGNGAALTDGDNPHIFTKKLYDESNFLLLGIPTTF